MLKMPERNKVFDGLYALGNLIAYFFAGMLIFMWMLAYLSGNGFIGIYVNNFLEAGWESVMFVPVAGILLYAVYRNFKQLRFRGVK